MGLVDLWSIVLEKISEKITKPSFETWFKGTEAEIEGDTLIIKARNPFAADWLEERYKSLINETVRETARKTYNIKIMSLDRSPENDMQVKRNDTSKTSNDHLHHLIEEQKRFMSKQQEKIEELEKRIRVLEQTALK